jgi:hypothetical protein
MAAELQVQTNMIKSARQQGGYGRKLSNRFTVGIPDLLVGIFPFVPALVEVKDLGVVVDTFDRQLEVTPKQADEMKRMSQPYESMVTEFSPWRCTAFVAVALVHRGKHRLVAVKRHVDRLSHTYEGDLPWVPRQTGGTYDLLRLMEGIGVCQTKVF